VNVWTAGAITLIAYVAALLGIGRLLMDLSWRGAFLMLLWVSVVMIIAVSVSFGFSVMWKSVLS
jgi:hypothetical protein